MASTVAGYRGALFLPVVPSLAPNPKPHNRLVRQGGPREALRSVPGADTALRGVGDDQLVLLLRARDVAAERALDELYGRYSASVYGLARRMLRDERVAEEVLQETFWRVWRSAERYEAGRVRFATWLLRITHNLSVSELRREAHRPRMFEARPGDDDLTAGGVPDVADTTSDVPEQVWHAEQRRAIEAGLSGLPAEQRQAVELAYLSGLTHVEIAARQGAPLSTVKTRLALGLRKLANHLRAQRVAADEDLAGG